MSVEIGIMSGAQMPPIEPTREELSSWLECPHGCEPIGGPKSACCVVCRQVWWPNEVDASEDDERLVVKGFLPSNWKKRLHLKEGR